MGPGARRVARRAPRLGMLGLGLLIAAGAAHALPMAVAFQGVTSGGLPFEGTVHYDASLPDADPDPSGGVFTDPLGRLEVDVGGERYTTDVGPLRISLRDDDRVDLGAVGGGIAFVDGISVGSDAMQVPGGAVVTEFLLIEEVVGGNPNPFLAGDFLRDGPALASLLVGADLRIRLAGVPGVPGFFGVVASARAVPEPSLLPLAVALAVVRRGGGHLESTG